MVADDDPRLIANFKALNEALLLIRAAKRHPTLRDLEARAYSSSDSPEEIYQTLSEDVDRMDGASPEECIRAGHKRVMELLIEYRQMNIGPIESLDVRTPYETIRP